MMFNPKFYWIFDDVFSVLRHIWTYVFWIGIAYWMLLYKNLVYFKYSVKEPFIMVTSYVSGLLNIPVKIYHFNSFNAFITTMIFLFVICGMVDLLIYYMLMKFPQIRYQLESSKKQSPINKTKNKTTGLIKTFEWFMILTFIYVYVTQLIIVSTWLILGFFLDPKAFVPICAGVLSFWGYAHKVNKVLTSITE